MKSTRSRSRSKNNRNRPQNSGGNVVNRVFDSSGPEGKVRGTPSQVIEKYNQLARDATLSNDRVAAENFQQHAEHYLRMLSEAHRERTERQERDGAQGGHQNNGNDQGGNDTSRNDHGQNEQGQREHSHKDHGQKDHSQSEQPDTRHNQQPQSAPEQTQSPDDSGLVDTPESKPKPKRAPRRKPKPKPDTPPEASGGGDQPEAAE